MLIQKIANIFKTKILPMNIWFDIDINFFVIELSSLNRVCTGARLNRRDCKNITLII